MGALDARAGATSPEDAVATAMPEAAGLSAPPSSDALENPLVRWLVTGGCALDDPSSLVRSLAQRIRAEGLPLMRMRITVRTLHPLVVGISYTWTRASDTVDVFEAPYTMLETDAYLQSPYAALFEGAGAIRRRLDGPGAVLDFPILEELSAEGATDYVAMPITFSDGRINAITFAADRPGGFASAELDTLSGMLPVLGRMLETFALRRTARTLLDTYLGRHTGERVLKGLIKRGDGEDIRAVIWFCDLRDSTPLADSMSRADFLALLNDFFDCTAGAVLERGGEVLRFIGDAVLAIFPIDDHGAGGGDGACSIEESGQAALAAAREAFRRLRDLNGRRREGHLAELRCGIALHVGEVTYGNIGTAHRLEFTVIGAAANEAARLEAASKELGVPLVISEDLAHRFPGEFRSLGRRALRGVSRARELFTVPGIESGDV